MKSRSSSSKRLGAFAMFALIGITSCRDVSGFATNGDHFEGMVAAGDFIRAGINVTTDMCLTLDTDHLQDAPGSIWLSDGRFNATPLRPIPQIWNDPLSTLNFGEGRLKNLVYVASPLPIGDGGVEPDITLVISLMQSNNIEVRLFRGAPNLATTDAAPSNNLFALFPLTRMQGACSF